MTNNPRGKGADRSFFSNCFSVVAFPCTLSCFLKLSCVHVVSQVCSFAPFLVLFLTFACSLLPLPSPPFLCFPSSHLSSSGHPAGAHNLCCFGALERRSGSLCVGQGTSVWMMWFSGLGVTVLVLRWWLDLMVLKVSSNLDDCDYMMLCLVCPRVELAFWCVGSQC